MRSTMRDSAIRTCAATMLGVSLYSTAGLGDPLITIITPAGGEQWEAATLHTLEWTATPDVERVVVSVSKNDGKSWQVQFSSSCGDASWRHASWEVPNLVSDSCKIKISGYQGEYPTVSPLFAITQTTQHRIWVTGPQSLTYMPGRELTIDWTTANVFSVRLDVTFDGGVSWQPVVDQAIDTADSGWGQSPFTLPDHPSTACFVRVKEDGDTATGYSPVFAIFGEDPVIWMRPAARPVPKEFAPASFLPNGARLGMDRRIPGIIVYLQSRSDIGHTHIELRR